MMAILKKSNVGIVQGPIRYTDASAANTALTLTIPAGKAYKFCWGVVKYSAPPTQTGVTFNLDSGAGAAYDAALETGTADAQVTVYIPSPNSLILTDADTIAITAPAAGGVITSQISAYVVEMDDV
jgi:hypothetical protein